MCSILFIGMFFDSSQKLALITGIPTLIILYTGYNIYYSKAKFKAK